MKLLNLFKSFKNDEVGAITVDWVVLTAAVAGLALVVLPVIAPSVLTLGGNIGSAIASLKVGY